MVEGPRTKGVEEGEKIVEAMSYVRNDLDWITNIGKMEEYGTGPVEKRLDIAVDRGFKRRGIGRYWGGANPLLKQRFLRSMENGIPIGMNDTKNMRDTLHEKLSGEKRCLSTEIYH